MSLKLAFLSIYMSNQYHIIEFTKRKNNFPALLSVYFAVLFVNHAYFGP